MPWYKLKRKFFAENGELFEDGIVEIPEGIEPPADAEKLKGKNFTKPISKETPMTQGEQDTLGAGMKRIANGEQKTLAEQAPDTGE